MKSRFTEDDLDLYPDSLTATDIRLKFIDVCNTILYSDDECEVNKAYTLLFGQFRNFILRSHKYIQLSCFEEVIYKILNDEEEHKYERTGEMYSPFVRLVGMMRDQGNSYSPMRSTRPNEYSIHSPLEFLKHYIVNYDILKSSQYTVKNQYIKTLLKKTYQNL